MKTDVANGVSLNTSNGEISVDTSGVYNVQFSIQAVNYSNSYDNFIIWFVKNGNDVSSSASQGTLVGKHTGYPGASIMTVNLFLSLTPTDKVQLYWTSKNGYAAIITGPAGTSPVYPTIPSTLLSVNQLG